MQETKVYKFNLVEEGVITFHNGSYCDSNLNLKFVTISKATDIWAAIVLFALYNNMGCLNTLLRSQKPEKLLFYFVFVQLVCKIYQGLMFNNKIFQNTFIRSWMNTNI